VANSAEQQNLVDFETLPRSTSETQAASTEFGLNVGLGDLQSRGEAFDDDNKGLTMRFTGGQIAQHDVQAIGGGVPVRVLPPYA
jgi:hypothetical protein